MSTAEENLRNLGLVLPPPPAPMGVYRPVLVMDKLVYVSGHGPLREDGSLIVGRVGLDLDEGEAVLAARQAGLAILSSLRSQLGSLNRIYRVIRVLGMVNAEPSFGRHPWVINGCSTLFADIWGPELGVGVRSAVGMGSLPGNIPVEIEAVFSLT